MNNPIKLLISGADLGGLIASCALRHDFHKSSRQEDRFQIYRIEKDTLTMEDVDACDLSGIRYAVNATLHDTTKPLSLSMRNVRSRASPLSMPSILARLPFSL